MVFVSSDESVLEQFQSRSAKSRMRKPPFEVGDINDEGAVEFLKSRGVGGEAGGKEAVRDIHGRAVRAPQRLPLLYEGLRGTRLRARRSSRRLGTP